VEKHHHVSLVMATVLMLITYSDLWFAGA